MRHSLFLLLTSLLLLLACKSEKPVDHERIQQLREQTEKLVKAQTLMSYDNWVHGLPSNQDSLYRASPDLFTRENILLLDLAEHAEGDSLQKKRLFYLRRYLTTEYISQRIAPLTDRVSNIEATAVVQLEGKSIPYRQVSVELANEQSPVRRAALYAATGPVLDSINTILREVEEANRSMAIELGYKSYNAMAEVLKQFSLSDLAETAEGILTGTEDQYKALLREVLAMVRLTPETFHRYDTGMLFRSKRFDKYFSREAMIATLEKTYGGMGVHLRDMGNLVIDTEPRPEKNPRAVCFTVSVPDDVRLSIKPVGGFDDYSALFHEAGHGLHYASTAEHAFEFKYLGEYTVTESFAFLSEYLLANQAWLRMNSAMPMVELKDFIRLRAFTRLYYIRRYAAKVLYERELHSGVTNPGEMYARLQSRAIGCRQSPEDEKRHLVDVDPLFYSATYLRAWFLEAQLGAKLMSEFGVNWFENSSAGEFLLSCWKRGDRLNGDEFAHSIGFDTISPDLLLSQIRMMVVFSSRPDK